MLLVAAVSAGRLAIAWRAGRRSDPDADIDVSHLLMGIAMAGTLTASLSTLPPLAWEIIFGALTVWFAARVTREYRAGRGLRALLSEHHAPHLLHSAAMLYMFLALRPAAAGMADMPGMAATGGQTLRLPTLALLFAFLLCAHVVADLDRLPAPRWLRPAAAPALVLASPDALATAGAPATATAGAIATAGVPAPVGFAVPAPVGRGVSATAPARTSTAAAPATPPAAATSATSLAAATPSASPVLAASLAPGLARLLSPSVGRGCRIAMGVTMAFMLIIMI
jgi:hypothetical protein